MTILRLVLGDQLNARHAWFTRLDAEVVYVMMEVRQETDYVLHHAQKVIAVFAAMRAFAEALRAGGHRVHYLPIDDPANEQSVPANLDWLLRHYRANRFEYQAPDEWRLDRQLSLYASGLELAFECVETQHFYCTRDEVAEILGPTQRWVMGRFYQALRMRHNVLLEHDGKPCGGRWSFDADNRKPWRGTPPEPPDARPVHDHRALWRQIEQAGVKTFGSAQAERFRWPSTRAEALKMLEVFVAQVLPFFGDYQDAMHTDARRLFHAQLSFALNVKLLDAREVVGAAEQAFRRGAAPIHAVEGFIRQVLGWREYVRGVYWARMPDYAQMNVWRHRRPLPRWFWNGRTGMHCLSQAIGQSLEDAYAHHIQRLMVIGNFALLAGLDPYQLHEWYLGVYIDAFEWVEMPNTLGMSQYADGGLMASKPYVSSAAYLAKMSNYCKTCRYDRRARVGETACPYNALYWNFFIRNASDLKGNPRVAIVYKQILDFTSETLHEIQTRSDELVTRIESL